MKIQIYSLLVSTVIIYFSCQEKKQHNNQYLNTFLNKLNEIKSAKYHTQKEAWDPLDTAATYIVNLSVHLVISLILLLF